MSLTEWIDHVVEGAVSTATMEAVDDPMDIAMRLEASMVEDFNLNLNGRYAE